jgi:hypothetical protein
VILTCDNGKRRVKRMFDTIKVLLFCMRGTLTLWRCVERACIASERFLLPGTDPLVFLVVRAGGNSHRARGSSLVPLVAILVTDLLPERHRLLTSQQASP